ncbi:MAG: hypothetical protein JXJ17_00280 [Anaerolineae bacterium]|nr:hypothetical protein [Anaerolineae bacterium]
MVLRSVISAAVLILYYLSTGLIIRQIGYGESAPPEEEQSYHSVSGPRTVRRTRWSRYGIPDNSY